MAFVNSATASREMSRREARLRFNGIGCKMEFDGPVVLFS